MEMILPSPFRRLSASFPLDVFRSITYFVWSISPLNSNPAISQEYHRCLSAGIRQNSSLNLCLASSRALAISSLSIHVATNFVTWKGVNSRQLT
jgi:hypothetical protein